MSTSGGRLPGSFHLMFQKIFFSTERSSDPGFRNRGPTSTGTGLPPSTMVRYDSPGSPSQDSAFRAGRARRAQRRRAISRALQKPVSAGLDFMSTIAASVSEGSAVAARRKRLRSRWPPHEANANHRHKRQGTRLYRGAASFALWSSACRAVGA